MRDFSFNLLKQLIITLRDSGYKIVRFGDYWSQRQEIDRLEKVVLLRHDVDRFPETALSIADMEAKLNVFGTFFFRIKSHVLKPVIVKKISEMGHEIGYHYECLADAKGNFRKAAELCKRDLEKLRELYPVVSAAMHSRPLSKWDNRLFWNHYSLEEFGLRGEAYLSIDYDKYVYLADSGRNWNANRNVIWDKVGGITLPKIAGTSGLIEMIKRGDFKKIHLLIHPNRWPSSMSGWLACWLMDMVINVGKKAIRQFYRLKKHGPQL